MLHTGLACDIVSCDFFFGRSASVGSSVVRAAAIFMRQFIIVSTADIISKKSARLDHARIYELAARRGICWSGEKIDNRRCQF
jgi:hypothetical protein